MSDRDNKIFDVEEAYSRTENYIEENKKSITFIVIVIFLLFAGYFGYKKFYLQPLEQKASQEIWKAEYYFEVDSLRKAMYGDTLTYFGFRYIADKYGNTTTGDLASYYLGVSHLNQRNHDQAIKWLGQCDPDDAIVKAVAQGALGDAYMEKEQFSQAIDHYENAANTSPNSFTSPIYLKKAGIAHEELGEFADAVEKYEKIEQEFPESSEAREMAKYIARAEAYIQE